MVLSARSWSSRVGKHGLRLSFSADKQEHNDRGVRCQASVQHRNQTSQTHRRSRQFAITLAMWILNVHVPVGSLRLAKNPAPELGQSWLDALLSTYNQTQLSAGGPRIYTPPLPLATGPFESQLLKKCFKNAMILQTWPRTRKRRWSLLASHKPLQNREGRPAPYCAQWNPAEMRGKLILKKMLSSVRA